MSSDGWEEVFLTDGVGIHAFDGPLIKHQGWPSLCCRIRPLYCHSQGISWDLCTLLAKNALGSLCLHLLSVLSKVDKGLAHPGCHVCGLVAFWKTGNHSTCMSVIIDGYITVVLWKF